MNWSRWRVLSFDPKRRYTSVRLQKGRVETDDDWNEDPHEDSGAGFCRLVAPLGLEPAAPGGWTDHNPSDPGTSLLEVIALLPGGIVVGTAAGWVFHRLPRPDFSVSVDGEQWDPVESLEHAGPDDHVYRLDPETGTVEFGDGERGKVPDGSVKIKPLYMRGVGVGGAIGASWIVAASSVLWLCRRRPRSRGRPSA